MTQEIGSNVGAVDVYYPIHGCRLNNSVTLVLAANQQLVEVGAMAHSGGPARSFKVAIHDVTFGVSGAPLLHTETVSVSGSTLAYFGLSDLAVDFSAHAGKVVSVSIGEADNTGVRYGKKPGSASTDSSGVFGASWNQTGTDTNQPVVYARFEDLPASGPTVSSITNPASDSMTITLSEAAATVDTINITYGGVTQSQSYITGDDTTFTIASLTRNLLPPTGTVTVTLLAGATEITSTTTVLDDIPGWETTQIGTPSFGPESVFYNYTGNTPDSTTKVRHDDPGNTTITSTGALTQVTPRTVNVEAWDDSDETYGTIGIWVWGVAKFANERWVAYLTTYKDVLATFGVDINTQVYRHLGSLGYTGLMPERLKQAKDDGVI